VDRGIAGAAFTALGDLPGPAAMAELWALHYWVTSSQHPHKVLVKSVKQAAARLGVPPHEFAEPTEPRHGLDSDGTLTVGWIGRGALWWNAALDAVLTVHDAGQVTVGWIEEDGTSTRTTAPLRSPTGYKTRTRADSVDYLRRHASRSWRPCMRSGYGLPRRPVRTAPGGGRTGSVRYYRDHPVTGVLARALEWGYEAPRRCRLRAGRHRRPGRGDTAERAGPSRPVEPSPGGE
jgi:hypothetical protein